MWRTLFGKYVLSCTEYIIIIAHIYNLLINMWYVLEAHILSIGMHPQKSSEATDLDCLHLVILLSSVGFHGGSSLQKQNEGTFIG